MAAASLIPGFREAVVHADRTITRIWQAFLEAVGVVLLPWTEMAYAATAFTGNGSMTWTVESADQVTLVYRLVGRTMRVAFTIRTTAIGGVLNTTLKIALPSGRVARRAITNGCWVVDNGTGQAGKASVAAGGTAIEIQKVTQANWVATPTVEGELVFEVNG